MDYLYTSYFNNPLWKWGLAAGIAVSILIVTGVLKVIIVHHLRKLAEKTRTDIDDLIVDLLGKTHFILLLLISVYLGSKTLSLPDSVDNLIRSLAIIAFLMQIAIWGSALITYWITRYAREKMKVDAASVTTISAFGFIGKWVLWSIIILLSLDNLGFDINALIAGLGIGGIAIALAAQSILGDLFASISIVLDKPFVVGDFIIVDELIGTVENIGLKTTRIRSLGGEQIVFSNEDLLSSRVRNYKRMMNRRIIFSIGVIYQIPYEKLAAIPSMIKEIIESHDNIRFDRAHFKEYGDFSLNFEIVYYMLVPAYNIYMDTQESINLAIFKKFEKEGIEFAYPTQTLFLEKVSAPPPVNTGNR